MKTQNIAEWTQQEVESLLGSVARYTKFVRSIKVLLSVLVAILIALVLFYPLIKKESNIRIVFTSILKGTKLAPTRMDNPRYHGLDKDDQPYNVDAKSAMQRDADTADLDKVSGDITMKNGQWLSISANTGVFKMKEHLLDLKGAVDMFTDEGYEFRTDVLHVNVANKTAVTQQEVQGQGPLGTIRAYGGAVVQGQAQAITFNGPVFVTVYPPKDDAKKDDAKKETKQETQ
jgi:lipopolysaccharide export system protein LptC